MIQYFYLPVFVSTICIVYKTQYGVSLSLSLSHHIDFVQGLRPLCT